MNGIRIKILAALKSGWFSHTRLPVLAVVGFVILMPALQRNAGAQAAGTVIKPTAQAKSAEVEERTEEAIERDETAFALMPQRRFVKPFMPTISPTEYAAAKKAAERATGPSRPSESGPQSRLQPLAPPSLAGPNFNGVSEKGSCGVFFPCAPPDTHGAVGLAHFVEVTNSRVSVYTKGGSLAKGTSLNAFFGVPVTTEFLFDPRVVYDRSWNRFIIMATRVSFSEFDPNRRFYLAVSKTSNPAGAYWKYTVTFDGGILDDGDWWDYPHLGMDQDAVIITGNIFDNPSGGFKGAAMMPIAKALIYNGLAFSVPVFTGLAGTLAPPIVLDQNVATFLVAAEPNDSNLDLYRGENLSRAFDATLVLQSAIAVSAYTIPPGAAQPGTASTLDTLDNRFVNASTQVGDSLWNVHTVDSSGFPRPLFYEIDTSGNSIIQSGFFFASLTSNDWNASIAVNDFGEAFVTWSSTDPTSNVNARVMFSGRQSGDVAGSMNAAPGGTVLFTSPTFYNDFTCSFPFGPPCRWGDYSAVTLDPTAYSITGGTCDAGRRAWIVNEKIDSQTIWGSRIGRIGFC